MLPQLSESLTGQPKEKILSYVESLSDFAIQQLILGYNPEHDPYGPKPSREAEIIGQHAITIKYRRTKSGSFNPIPPEPAT